MAGILDMLGNTDVLGTRQKAQDRLAAKRTTLIERLSSNAPSGRAEAGGAVGAALGQALGAGAAAALGITPVDAEVTKAEANAKLAQEIQALSQGEGAPAPGTSAHLAAAGQKAQEAGRTDLALQFAEQSAAMRVREDALVAKTDKEAAEAERSAFSGMPNSVKLSITANDPARVQRVLGLTASQAKVIAKDAQDTLKTLQAKNQKALDDLNAVRVTKSTSEDVTQSEGLLLNRGIGGFSFEGFAGRDNPERATNFARLMDQQASKEIDAAAKKGVGVRLSKDEIYNEIMTTLSARGGVEGWGTGDVTGIDLDAISTIFTERSKATPVTTQPNAPTTSRRRVRSP